MTALQETYACMMHHPQGFQAFIALCLLAAIGALSFIAAGLALLDHMFRPRITVPTFNPLPELEDV